MFSVRFLSFFLVFIFSNFSTADVQILSRDTYTEQLEVLLHATDYEVFSSTLKQLKKTPTFELRNTLEEKLDSILMLSREEMTSDAQELSRVISDVLDVLLKIGHKDNVHVLSQLSIWLEHNIDNKPLSEKIFETGLALNEIPVLELPSINEAIQDQSRALVAIDNNQNKREYELALRRAEDILSRMRAKVIEQDEILKDLQALFIKDTIIDGQREAPEILYLMGLPGSGKDTIAEAYVDAIWDEPGAHERHMFRFNVRTKQEMWSLLGSGKGFVGSSELPAFLRFLVEHSGGKYALKEIEDSNGKKKMIVVKGPNFDKPLTGTRPHRAVVFVNESHNIPKEVKDNILKQAIERGIFPITNPGPTNDSVDHIKLPVTFVFASNEGISLIEPREKNGSRMGDPLSYEELLKNYQRVKDDKEKLKQAILSHNGEKNDPVAEGAPGTSEEFLSRIPSGRIHLLKPISPDGLMAITRLFEQGLTARLRETDGDMGKFDVRLSDELVEFLISYNSIPADGARPLKDRLETFVFKPLYDSMISRRIRPTGEDLTVTIGLKEYQNNAKSLAFSVVEGNFDQENQNQTPDYTFTRLIESTLNDRPQNALSDKEIKEILTLREKILSNVFGVEHIVDRLIGAVLTSESESRNSESKRSATVMAFLGKTSTGKTEAAKQYVYARYGEDQRPAVIDFNGIRDLQSMKAKILGTVDSRNNPIASDFMKAYDRANGKIAFIFDEAANAPKELLKGLYEILRESVVTGFSDGKPRPMKDVSIILTGNAGETIYNGISTDLSTRRYAQAMEEVFKIFVRNESMQAKVLTQTFPEALLARIGRNIFHFGPLSNKSKRQIAQLKLLQGLERLLPKPSERGWHIQFASEKDLLDLFQMVEIEGYNHAYQGASIDKFVKEAIIDSIKTELLSSSFKNDSTVLLSLGPISKSSDNSNSPPYRVITLTSESGREAQVKVELQRLSEDLPQPKVLRQLTTFHEVGHEIVSHYFFHDIIDPTVLKILPGVAIIGNELVPYSGIRGGVYNKETVMNKEFALRKIAILFGGFMAEQAVTFGNHHASGKSNDIKRATDMIHQAVLMWGLSEEWGKTAIPSNTSISDYIDKFLSEGEKQKLESITQRWLTEAEEMAQTAIMSNLGGAFYNLSLELAKEGELSGEQILQVYERSGFVYNASAASSPEFNPKTAYENLNSLLKPNKKRLLELYSHRQKDDDSFYERAFNDLSSWSVGALWRTLRRYRLWSDLNSHEKLMAQAIISQMFEVKTLFPDLVDESWDFEDVVDPDEMLANRAEKEKEGVIKTENFDVYPSTPALEDGTEMDEPGTGLTCKSLLAS